MAEETRWSLLNSPSCRVPWAIVFKLGSTAAHMCPGINRSFCFCLSLLCVIVLQFLILSVEQVMSAWWTEMWHHCWLAGWRCAFLECGVRSVMMGGTKEMPRLYASNWDQHHYVSWYGWMQASLPVVQLATFVKCALGWSFPAISGMLPRWKLIGPIYKAITKLLSYNRIFLHCVWPVNFLDSRRIQGFAESLQQCNRPQSSVTSLYGSFLALKLPY